MILAQAACTTMRSSLRKTTGALLEPCRTLQAYVLKSNKRLHLHSSDHASPHVTNATPAADDSSANWSRPDLDAADVHPAAPPSKVKLWLACIKFPMYTVAITPMVLGAVLAYYVTGVFNGAACSNLTLGGILVIAWLNLR